MNENELYPAPRINWYPVTDRHPSLADGAAPEGFRQPLALKAQQARKAAELASRLPSRPAAAPASQGHILVEVVAAQGIAPPEDEPAGGPGEVCSYMVSAFYQGEPQVVADQRRTEPCQGEPSRSFPSREDCTLQARVKIPYNSKQQFVKVALYRRSLHGGDPFVGEATVPIADPSVAEINTWSLKLPGDFVERGYLRLSVKLPGDYDEEAEEATPAAASAAAPSSSSASSPSNISPAGVSPAVVPHFPQCHSFVSTGSAPGSTSYMTPTSVVNGMKHYPPPLVTICESDIPVAPPAPPSRIPPRMGSNGFNVLISQSGSAPGSEYGPAPPLAPHLVANGYLDHGGGDYLVQLPSTGEQRYSPQLPSSEETDSAAACCPSIPGSMMSYVGQGLSAAPYVPRQQTPQMQQMQQSAHQPPQLLQPPSLFGSVMGSTMGSTLHQHPSSGSFMPNVSTTTSAVSYPAQTTFQSTPWQQQQQAPSQQQQSTPWQQQHAPWRGSPGAVYSTHSGYANSQPVQHLAPTVSHQHPMAAYVMPAQSSLLTRY